MNICVLMKRTFDTEEQVRIQDNQVLTDGAQFIINPYDEYALEEAIQIKEKLGAQVTVLSVGTKDVEKQLRIALAMGADQAVLIEEDRPLDEQGISHLLETYLQKQNVDLVLAGNMSVDHGAGQVAVRVAQLLNIPQVTTITSLDIDNHQVTVQRDVEGDLEVIEASLPLLLTAQQGLNEPRYPSLPNIMKSKKKPLAHLQITDLEIDEAKLELNVELVDMFLPAKKEQGRVLEGELKEQVQELVNILKDQEKVV